MAEPPIKLFSSRSERYPEPNGSDLALGAARAAVAAVPIVGGSATEMLSMVLAPSLARRRDQWFKEIAQALEQLEAKVDGFRIDNLSENEAFVSAIIEASKTAVATHQREKHEVLRNAMLNIALQCATDEDQQQIFLRYIAELTIWHIRFLAFFQAPQVKLAAKGVKTNYLSGGGSDVLEDYYPELQGKREFCDQIAADLDARGLIGGRNFLHSMMSAQGMVAKRTTPLADQFLAFISEPPELKPEREPPR
jgi:hypothetical protein